MSAITLKKKKRMLFIPLDFENTRIDALVDSGAYINVISERDADKIQTEANATIIAKAPPPPFKIQYANTELEKARATYTMQFKIGDYAFEETFIIMTKTSYPIIGPAFLRKHSAILDTAQGTINFPKIQITLALKDEDKSATPNPSLSRRKKNTPYQPKPHGPSPGENYDVTTKFKLRNFYSYGSANHNTDGSEMLSEDETNRNKKKNISQ